MNFLTFKAAVAAQFERMQKHQMFRVDIEKQLLWDTYLASFRPEDNPIYRKRTEHDCACCRSFIKSVGDCVAVIDGQVVSIWDIDTISVEQGYDIVAFKMAVLVKSRPIANRFLSPEKTVGTDKNFEQLVGGTKTWNHFFAHIDKQFVEKKDNIPTKLGEQRSSRYVFHRSLRELTLDSVDTVLELIAQNSLYRGEEHKAALLEFRKLKVEFDKLSVEEQDLFTWTNKTFEAVYRMKNTSIGTLLDDLSTGVELEKAVKSFEAKVAPANYKRPTALVTPSMIASAKAKVEELGLTSALQRRYATSRDITANNILFADRTAKKSLGGDVFDSLSEQVGAKTKSFDKVAEMTVEKFLSDVVPKAESIEVLLENRLQANLVSIIAPVDPTAQPLFKWGNDFSWSYNGEVADSIKERVKAAGGSVEGDLCCRLAWDNKSDLDFHMMEPGGGHIYYPYRRSLSNCGGMLDLDANGADGQRDDPAENIYYADRRKMKEGKYHLYVNMYSNRSTSNEGFQVEIDYLGTVYRFAYDKRMSNHENVTVAVFKYTHAEGLVMESSLPSSQVVRNDWALPTQNFHRVKLLMLSPNHWGDRPVGNRHYMFMLEGCKNEFGARGFYNEFLKSELDPHRKVFEMLGSKLKPEAADDQLSGLGFSSTQPNHIICRVKGSFTRDLKVTF